MERFILDGEPHVTPTMLAVPGTDRPMAPFSSHHCRPHAPFTGISTPIESRIPSGGTTAVNVMRWVRLVIENYNAVTGKHVACCDCFLMPLPPSKARNVEKVSADRDWVWSVYKPPTWRLHHRRGSEMRTQAVAKPYSSRLSRVSTRNARLPPETAQAR